nr:MAG TPA: Protein of unknown function (DUF1492) [Caudoviricetes sp.]
MTAKQYLSQIRILDTKINIKTQELKELRCKIEGLSSLVLMADKVQSSPIHDKISGDIAKLLELEAQIVCENKELEKLKHKIINEIAELKNPLFIKILFKRYVEFKSLERIAADLNYSYIHIRREHGYALEVFKNQILKR